MTTELDYTSKSYDDGASTLTKVPSYTQAEAALFPSQLPCSLVIKNLDRVRDPILLVDTKAGEQVVFELSNLTHDRDGSFDESLYQNLMADGGYSAPSKVLVAAERQAPYAMRKHVASSTYEVIQLQKDGSFGAVTKIQIKGLFKNKYYLEQAASSSGSKPEDSSMYIKGSFKALNASLRRIVDGQKSTLLEVVKGVTSTQAHFSDAIDASSNVPFLVAAMYAALDTHKEHFLTFTTDEKLEDLQARVKPSAWDSLFLQAGQTSKKQKEFSQQLETERRREYNDNVHGNGPFRNGMIPAQQRSESGSRSRSRSRNASPAAFNRAPVPTSTNADATQERGRQ